MPLPTLHDAMTTQHDQARARFEQLAASRDTLDKVRGELGTLSDLGDTVTPEDVIKGAGKLVAHGLSPSAMAQLLAQMPDGGGEALQGWLAQHQADLGQREAQLEPLLAQARHEMGLAGLRLVAAHLHPQLAPQPPQGPAPSDSTTMNLASGAPANA
jgi:hypothetical protein